MTHFNMKGDTSYHTATPYQLRKFLNFRKWIVSDESLFMLKFGHGLSWQLKFGRGPPETIRVPFNIFRVYNIQQKTIRKNIPKQAYG